MVSKASSVLKNKMVTSKTLNNKIEEIKKLSIYKTLIKYNENILENYNKAEKDYLKRQNEVKSLLISNKFKVPIFNNVHYIYKHDIMNFGKYYKIATFIQNDNDIDVKFNEDEIIKIQIDRGTSKSNISEQFINNYIQMTANDISLLIFDNFMNFVTNGYSLIGYDDINIYGYNLYNYMDYILHNGNGNKLYHDNISDIKFKEMEVFYNKELKDNLYFDNDFIKTFYNK